MTTAYETRQQTVAEPNLPWTEKFAEKLAREFGISQLTDAHWKIIHTLRTHFVQYGALPPMHFACDISHLGPHCVDHLFHSPRIAWRIAGLPDPGDEARVISYPAEMVQH